MSVGAILNTLHALNNHSVQPPVRLFAHRPVRQPDSSCVRARVQPSIRPSIRPSARALVRETGDFKNNIHQLCLPLQNTVKHDNASMHIRRNSPGQDLGAELPEKQGTKVTKSVEHVRLLINPTVLLEDSSRDQ